MTYPKATEIPALFQPGSVWMVDLGPEPSDRFYGPAPDSETAIRYATEERDRRRADERNCHQISGI